MMSRTHMLAGAVLACALGAPSLAAAQATGGYPPGTPVSAIEARERAETERLNSGVLERDAQVVAANEAEAERFARAQAAYEAEMRANAAAQDAYAVAREEHRRAVMAAEDARLRYEADMAAWRARTGRPY